MPAQLIVHCPEHLEIVQQFADRTNQRAAFETKLDDLTRYKRDDTTIHLYTDFAPYSFYWVQLAPDNKTVWMNGGLIYHGAHDGGGNGSAPTFSVYLTPCTGWAIHT